MSAAATKFDVETVWPAGPAASSAGLMSFSKEPAGPLTIVVAPKSASKNERAPRFGLGVGVVLIAGVITKQSAGVFTSERIRLEEIFDRSSAPVQGTSSASVLEAESIGSLGWQTPPSARIQVALAASHDADWHLEEDERSF